MHNNLELAGPGETIYRQVNLTVSDSSDTTLFVNSFNLSGGKWDPNNQPSPGEIISPGNLPNFINFTDAPFTAVGGMINLGPASGGSITINWSWPYGGSFQTSSSSSGTSNLKVTYQVSGQTGTSVNLQYIISNQ